MKNSNLTIFSLVFFLLLTAQVFSQGTREDPLVRIQDLNNSDEIILFNSQMLGSDPNIHTTRARILDLNLNESDPNQKILPKNIQTDSVATGNKRMSVTSGNFIGGRFKHFVAAWTGRDNSIIISVPQIVSGSLDWTNSNRLILPNATMPASSATHNSLKVISGNFFGDRKDELVMGYIGADSTIKLKLINININLIPSKSDSINNEHAAFPTGQHIEDFDIAVGDFDGDGYQEIGLLFVKKQGLSDWSVSLRIYKINSQGNFEIKGTTDLFNEPSYYIGTIQISASSNDFNHDAIDEIAAGYSFTHSEPNQPGAYINIIEVKDSLNNVVANSTRRVTFSSTGSGETYPFDLSAADLNGDGVSDVVVGKNGSLAAFQVEGSTLIPGQIMNGPSVSGWDNLQQDLSDGILFASDLDYNRSADITVVGNSYNQDEDTQQFNIYVYEIDTAFTHFVVKGRKENYENIQGSSRRHFTLAAGDFDGDRARLGPPVHRHLSQVKQTLVVLNTPPVHFDKFESGTETYDISGCFTGTNCGFSSDYIQSQSIDTTIEVSLHTDWGLDAQLGYGYEEYGISVGGWVTATYEEGFDNVASSGSTFRVTEGRRAEGGDWTYLIVQDYDFYEYPIYDSLNQIRGHILTSVPGPAEKIWVESKDDNVIGNLYKPGHEVGNVMSYLDPNSLPEDTSEIIYNFNSQTIGASGSSFVELELSNFNSSGASTTTEVGIGAIAHFPFIQLEGHYTQTDISSVTVSVGSSMLLRGDLGHLSSPFNTPQNTYYITPFSYWADNGAMVFDYKVSFGSDPGSFWNTKYGNKTDLAISLPWRLDPEKGLSLPGGDSAYRFRSKDIQISKPDPQAGDTITIKARVNNYALMDVTDPVAVRFFAGNPNDGGVQIGEATITDGIQSRKSKYATISWIVPPLTPRSTRMYAVIDPENAITNEVHENNNKGWTPLSDYSSPVGINTFQNTEVPEKFELFQNFPNPFNPSTTIRFSIPNSSITSLKIYNILGKEMKTLVNEKLNAGTYDIVWNASELSSGVYFYSLKVDNKVETKKLILMK